MGLTNTCFINKYSKREDRPCIDGLFLKSIILLLIIKLNIDSEYCIPSVLPVKWTTLYRMLTVQYMSTVDTLTSKKNHSKIYKSQSLECCNRQNDLQVEYFVLILHYFLFIQRPLSQLAISHAHTSTVFTGFLLLIFPNTVICNDGKMNFHTNLSSEYYNDNIDNIRGLRSEPIIPKFPIILGHVYPIYYDNFTNIIYSITYMRLHLKLSDKCLQSTKDFYTRFFKLCDSRLVSNGLAENVSYLQKLIYTVLKLVLLCLFNSFTINLYSVKRYKLKVVPSIGFVLDSERSEECIDSTMMGGFRWQIKYPWCIIKVTKFNAAIVHCCSISGDTKLYTANIDRKYNIFLLEKIDLNIKNAIFFFVYLEFVDTHLRKKDYCQHELDSAEQKHNRLSRLRTRLSTLFLPIQNILIIYFFQIYTEKLMFTKYIEPNKSQRLDFEE
ncbi:hypothetical protein AGLY_000268 [Aphis glycines]|uniref:Uncharacterized protein n=1 Tax=Aphis glycines TaxID=307491 RepID=A0A6G0U928_APHGL|nr:hypothetical protein AGLY_000268 [Aphis glycines]